MKEDVIYQGNSIISVEMLADYPLSGGYQEAFETLLIRASPLYPWKKNTR